MSLAEPFRRFIGDVNPLLAMAAAGVAGAVFLSFLRVRYGFAIFRKENLRFLPGSSAIAVSLAGIAILVDLRIVYPADMNVPYPESLLFYPAIGFLVENVFHVVPLALLLLLLTPVARTIGHEKVVWIAILFVSLPEAVYQVVWMSNSSHYPSWAVAYIGLHVFVFNLCELAIFKRYDFSSMYAFRLAYYALWHVAWGYLRLKLLF
jgi:hypothetical protein